MGLQQLQVEQHDMDSISEEIYVENGDEIVESNSADASNLEEMVEDKSSTREEGHAEDAYIAWMLKHPSAISKFDQMMEKVKEKKLVVFLDYDGTLSPIVDNPDQAFMSDSMRSTLNKVAQYFPTCIISGRRRDRVYEFVQLTNVYYIGSHGMDIMAPIKSLDVKFYGRASNEQENEVALFQPAQEFLPVIEQIFMELEEKTNDICGVMIENNKFCLSVHFRRVDEENWPTLEERVITIAKEYPSLHLTKGRKVIEIRPCIKWDKGRALEYLLDTLGFGSCGEALPLYIGDDRTDEDAFQVLQSRGQGHSIIVSSIPKNTKASYSLRDPSEVMAFLSQLSRWKRNSFNNRMVV